MSTIETMQLPRKITPDNIHEAVVELKYNSDISFEILIGIFFSLLDEKYTYTNRPLQQSVPSIALSNNLQTEVNFKFGVQNIFYTENIQIVCSPNTIVFSSVHQYVGWIIFHEEIKSFINQIWKSDKLKNFFRIGVRYITHYAHQELKNLIKFQFSFGLPQIKSTKFLFKSEFDWDEFHIILNLSSRYFSKQTIQSGGAEIKTEPLSIVDIDTICQIEISNLNELYKMIESTHLKEKEVFFNLIDENYLKTLNPEY